MNEKKHTKSSTILEQLLKDTQTKKNALTKIVDKLTKGEVKDQTKK